MSETPVAPEPTPNPAVVILQARRAELVGGEQSIGVQEQEVARMQAALDEALACLAACETELAALDEAIALLAPVPEVPEVEV